MANDLRRRFRAIRRALPLADQRQHALAVRDTLASLRLLDGAGPIGTYLAFDGELDLEPTIAQCWSHGTTVAVPTIRDDQMVFARYPENGHLTKGPYGIREPNPAEPVDQDALALVLLPLTAFTDSGERLGMGSGFYDKTFSGDPHPLLIGVAHEAQRADRLDTNPWDVPLDAVVTERGWREISARARTVSDGAKTNDP